MKVTIRKIAEKDNPAVAKIIREVMPEFGATAPGFAIHDAEVMDMFDAYQREGCAYFVCDINSQVIGGGGIAPLEGGDASVCELKKMYFLTGARGKGYGYSLLNACIMEARRLGYKSCYLETFHSMKDAIRLYEKAGFKSIPGPMGNTGHFACDTFFVKDLANSSADQTYTPA
jgi:putative acetyltransferase